MAWWLRGAGDHSGAVGEGHGEAGGVGEWHRGIQVRGGSKARRRVREWLGQAGAVAEGTKSGTVAIRAEAAWWWRGGMCEEEEGCGACNVIRKGIGRNHGRRFNGMLN